MPPSGTPVPLGERCTTPYVYNKLVRLSFGFFPSHSVQGTEIDQNVDEGVLIGDGPTIAQSGALNAELLYQGGTFNQVAAQMRHIDQLLVQTQAFAVLVTPGKRLPAQSGYLCQAP